MSIKLTYIIVKLQYEAIHNWPDCNIEEVEFLKYPHRHIFYIKCKKHVYHNDRDIEIIKFKRQILNYLNHKYEHDLGAMSCEMLANELVDKFELLSCEVLEDNENGAIVEVK